MNEIFTLCREANVVLGPLAFGVLCYRVTIGLREHRIVYWPLLLVLTYYALVVALTAPTGVVLSAPVTYLQPMFTVGHLALIAVCAFFPGPLKKDVTAAVRPFPFDDSNHPHHGRTP